MDEAALPKTHRAKHHCPALGIGKGRGPCGAAAGRQRRRASRGGLRPPRSKTWEEARCSYG
eukprot:4296614-Alexandrium_andersonii.AAC.1